MRLGPVWSHRSVENWRQGRWWLNVRERSSLTFEWHLFSGRCSLGVTVDDDEDDLLLHLSPVLFSVYLSLSAPPLRRVTRWLLRGSYEGREISLRVHDWAIWWECWAPAMSWSNREPWWMRWTWHPLDTLFGGTHHRAEEVSRTDAFIPMPERAYPCTVVLKDEVWKRPRLPWASTRLRRAHIECPSGVPHPGKGENSWDCDQDATFSLTCPARTVEQGIAAFVESVMRSRRRHGGSVNWSPREGANA